MSYTDESIKIAVEALRENHLEEFQTKLKPTHAHELVAACLGYKSKIALKSDEGFYLDPDEPETLTFLNSEENIYNRINNLNGLNVGDNYSQQAEKIILSSIQPDCSGCGEGSISVVAAETDDNNYEQLWFCDSCVSEGIDVGYCRYCGENEIFPAALLNNAMECPIHAGESSMSEEEQRDMESFIEYHTKD